MTKVREDLGWSKAELARRAGMNAASISRIENGREKPYDSQLLKIADAIGWKVHPSKLMEVVK